MPAATFNRDRATGQQRPTSRYQDMTEGDSNTTQQAYDLAHQYNQDLLNGVPHDTPSIETFVMSLALEQEISLEISSFSSASQGNPLSSLTSNPNCDPASSQAGQQGSANINQTQLLSGSRS
ncbi:hypothetical protein BGZ58_001860 [Dissophora ornata]|nr:hypothetical protein BGZ58_001860 [Dissophora ornata]